MVCGFAARSNISRHVANDRNRHRICQCMTKAFLGSPQVQRVWNAEGPQVPRVKRKRRRRGRPLAVGLATEPPAQHAATDLTPAAPAGGARSSITLGACFMTYALADEGRFRTLSEILNAHLFDSLADVREVTAAWLLSFNTERPRDSLGRVPPLPSWRERTPPQSPATPCLLGGGAYPTVSPDSQAAAPGIARSAGPAASCRAAAALPG